MATEVKAATATPAAITGLTNAKKYLVQNFGPADLYIGAGSVTTGQKGAADTIDAPPVGFVLRPYQIPVEFTHTTAAPLHAWCEIGSASFALQLIS